MKDVKEPLKHQIMVVDDEEDILTALQAFYEQYGIEVIAVDNGKECIKQLEQGFKGVVLIDLMMPKMTGWDTIKEIINRGLEKDIDISIITGRGTKEHQNIIEYAPYIKDYISKPFDEKTLLTILEE